MVSTVGECAHEKCEQFCSSYVFGLAGRYTRAIERVASRTSSAIKCYPFFHKGSYPTYTMAYLRCKKKLKVAQPSRVMRYRQPASYTPTPRRYDPTRCVPTAVLVARSSCVNLPTDRACVVCVSHRCATHQVALPHTFLHRRYHTRLPRLAL